MYILKDNRLIKVDTTEDSHISIKAIKEIVIPNNVKITSTEKYNMDITDTKQFILKHELDGYIFRDPITNRRLSGWETTVGNAIMVALRLGYKVYNDDVEITKPNE